LPSGAVLALTVAVTAATTVMAAGPAAAGPVRHAAGRAGPATPAAKAGKIRDSEWWLGRMNVTQAWRSSRGAGVTVALLSTGVLTSHPDLTGSVITGPDYTGSGETSASTTWGIEGTSAASIIAGHGDNAGDAAGIIGIAPAARILSIRVAFDAADTLNASATAVRRLPDAIAQGIRYAVAQGAKIIDLPLDPATLASDGAATGGLAAAAGGSATERSAVSYALSKGVVLVAPAGDNGEDGNTASFPASYSGVIALAAIDRHGNRAAFSTRQSYVAMTAPGVGVTAASRPSGYRTMSTTDAASAMVTGVAALIRSRYPELTGSQVRQALITSSGSPPSPAAGTGGGTGTVDALKAVQAAAVIAAPQPPARPSSPAATAAGTMPPLTTHPKPGTVGMARSALRDAAAAAGALIVLLLGVLLGIRLWRRRAEQETRSAPEPRTLLGAPSGPPSGPLPIQAGNARHARPGEGAAFAAAAPASPVAPAGRPGPAGRPSPVPSPGPVPDPVSPRFAPPGAVPGEFHELDDAGDAAAEEVTAADPAVARGRARNRGRSGRSGAAARISAHGLRLRVAPASRTAPRSDVNAPGSPPWEPATAPGNELPNEPRRRVPDPLSTAARPAPATQAPWDPTGLGGAPLGADPAAGRPPAAWRPIPPAGTPLPSVPAPPAGFPAAPGDPAAPGGLVSYGGPASAGGLGGPAVPGDPLRPISPLDRLPLSGPGEPGPGSPRPAGAATPPGTTPWLIPGSSGRFPGAGEEDQAAPEPGWSRDAYPGRTGRLSRPGEFLPPYAGRPAPADEPPPEAPAEGPQPAKPASSGRPGDAPSGPLYIWNPATLAEPFPPAPPGAAEADDDAGPHHRA
jgi:subtilisin family serine protease